MKIFNPTKKTNEIPQNPLKIMGNLLFLKINAGKYRDFCFANKYFINQLLSSGFFCYHRIELKKKTSKKKKSCAFSFCWIGIQIGVADDVNVTRSSEKLSLNVVFFFTFFCLESILKIEQTKNQLVLSDHYKTHVA